MANYATLKAAIESVIRTNGNEEITGEILQNAIIALIESLGAKYQFAGIATPGSSGTNPGTPDYNVMYIAGVGTYPNFGGTDVEKGHIGVFAYNGTWDYETIETGAYFEYEEYPQGAAVEFTFYDSVNPDGVSIKINKDVSNLYNEPDAAISQWWAAQMKWKMQDVQGYTDTFPSLSTNVQTLGVFGVIKAGKVIDSITGANKLIFIAEDTTEYVVTPSDLPYKAPVDLVSVKLESGTASNVSIHVRGDMDMLISHININEIANHPAAYADAATALGDVPTLYRRKGMKVVYFDNTQQLWIEMINVDDAGANWWTDVTNNWVIEGPIETNVVTATGGQQLRIAGEKRGNLDDVLNVNVWNGKITGYESQAAARAAVPANKRKLGLIITYLLSIDENTSQWVQDMFIGDNIITDWSVADNWQVVGPVRVSRNALSIGNTQVGTVNDVFNVNSWNNQPTTPYNILEARSYVPISKRKQGMIITYLTPTGWVTERYIADDVAQWSNGLNWQAINDADNGGIIIDALHNATGYIGRNGNIVSNTNFNYSNFISVREGDIIYYTGIIPNNVHGIGIAGYDDMFTFVGVLLETDGSRAEYFIHRKVTISNTVKYIRVCVGNSTRADYQIPNVVICKNAQYFNDVDITLRNIQQKANRFDDNGKQVIEILNLRRSLIFDLDAEEGGRIMWGQLPSIPARIYITGFSYIDNQFAGPTLQIRTTRGGTLIRTISITPGYYEYYAFDLTQADIEAGATYFRIAAIHYEDVSLLSVYYYDNSNGIRGKKIAVIGDSISTIWGNNNPYYKIKSIDVGNEIQSYVTWWDVWANDAGTNPTNKTIGGVALTAAMIGTLQTFTPVAGDVGKQIGVPFDFNSSSTKVWSQYFCEKTGAILLANAAWSGSRICAGQTGTYVLSEAWNDYTIGCCKTRDDEGNIITPDIIIIYRGTNDFSHNPISRINDVSLANGIPSTDYINSVYEYRAGYYKTIQKLREAYPKAYIVCCTLNVFKRMTYDVFPTRNSYYTLPQMNDVIRDIANVMGCGLIEFDKDGITFENCYSEGYITDSPTQPTHPNSKGHEVMAERAISDLKYCLNH